MNKFKKISILLFTISYFSCFGQLGAVVVSTTTGNTDRPPEDPGWDNVVNVRGSSGVYLGNRWILTAAHVGAGKVLIPGIDRTFSAVEDTRIQLKNPNGRGLSAAADLIMFQIDDDPNLPPLRISSKTPDAGMETIMIGKGKDRVEDGNYWDVSGRDWTVTDEETEYFGFPTRSSSAMRWGTNLIERDDLFERRFDNNNYLTLPRRNADTLAVVTEFDGGAGFESNNITRGSDGLSTTDHESQAVRNDSGGPIFIKRNGVWLVGGIMLATQGFDNQPEVSLNAIFGNLTFSADLSHYRHEILQNYIRGDFDDDGILGVTDIDLLTMEQQTGQNQPSFDLNRDGFVDQLDRVIWVEGIRTTYFGDSNLDGQFSTSDLVQVFEAAEYEDAVPGNSTWATGDWNGDGEFSTSDFVLALQQNSFEQGPRPTPVPVPEPTSVFLFYFLVAALALKQCRQRS